MPFIHTYGVTGVLVEVEVRTDPARDWTAVYAAFDSYAGLAAGLRAMGALDPLPRLVSGDEPALVPTLPASVDAGPAVLQPAGDRRVLDARPGARAPSRRRAAR